MRCPNPKARPAFRALTLFVLAAFLYSTLSVPYAQATLWQERRAALQKSLPPEKKDPPTADPLQLAQLPAGLSPISDSPAISSTLSEIALNAAAAPSEEKAALQELSRKYPVALQSLPPSRAEIRKIHFSSDPGAPLVVLIQDVHQVESAQKNIAQILRHLSAQGRNGDRLLVGMEAAQGAFDLERYRGLEDKTAREETFEFLLQKSFISGAEYFGLTEPTEPLLWGVEDEPLYLENVESWRRGERLLKDHGNPLPALRESLLSIERRSVPQEQQDFERTCDRFESGEAGITDFVKTLAAQAPTDDFPELSKFLRALEMEKGLDFKSLEKQRAALLKELSQKLSPAQLQSLVQASLAYRLGQVNHAGYYKILNRFLSSQNIRLEIYPEFKKYLEYVFASDGIRAARLFQELESFKTQARENIARNPLQKKISEAREDLRLLEKSVRHEMTPESWARYESRKNQIAQLYDRLQEFRQRSGTSVLSPRPEDWDEFLSTFADFNRVALRRNRALVGNLLARMNSAQGKPAPLAVLIAGGFHTEGLQKELEARGLSYATLAPKIGKVENGAGYLQVFSETRTPIEKMLLGERIYLGRPCTLARSVAAQFGDLKRLTEMASAEVYGALAAQEGRFDPDAIAAQIKARIGVQATVAPEKSEGVYRLTIAHGTGKAELIVIVTPHTNSESVRHQNLVDIYKKNFPAEAPILNAALDQYDVTILRPYSRWERVAGLWSGIGAALRRVHWTLTPALLAGGVLAAGIVTAASFPQFRFISLALTLAFTGILLANQTPLKPFALQAAGIASRFYGPIEATTRVLMAKKRTKTAGPKPGASGKAGSGSRSKKPVSRRTFIFGTILGVAAAAIAAGYVYLAQKSEEPAPEQGPKETPPAKELEDHFVLLLNRHNTSSDFDAIRPYLENEVLPKSKRVILLQEIIFLDRYVIPYMILREEDEFKKLGIAYNMGNRYYDADKLKEIILEPDQYRKELQVLKSGYESFLKAMTEEVYGGINSISRSGGADALARAMPDIQFVFSNPGYNQSVLIWAVQNRVAVYPEPVPFEAWLAVMRNEYLIGEVSKFADGSLRTPQDLEQWWDDVNALQEGLHGNSVVRDRSANAFLQELHNRQPGSTPVYLVGSAHRMDEDIFQQGFGPDRTHVVDTLQYADSYRYQMSLKIKGGTWETLAPEEKDQSLALAVLEDFLDPRLKRGKDLKDLRRFLDEVARLHPTGIKRRITDIFLSESYQSRLATEHPVKIIITTLASSDAALQRQINELFDFPKPVNFDWAPRPLAEGTVGTWPARPANALLPLAAIAGLSLALPPASPGIQETSAGGDAEAERVFRFARTFTIGLLLSGVAVAFLFLTPLNAYEKMQVMVLSVVSILGVAALIKARGSLRFISGPFSQIEGQAPLGRRRVLRLAFGATLLAGLVAILASLPKTARATEKDGSPPALSSQTPPAVNAPTKAVRPTFIDKSIGYPFEEKATKKKRDFALFKEQEFLGNTGKVPHHLSFTTRRDNWGGALFVPKSGKYLKLSKKLSFNLKYKKQRTNEVLEEKEAEDLGAENAQSSLRIVLIISGHPQKGKELNILTKNITLESLKGDAKNAAWKGNTITKKEIENAGISLSKIKEIKFTIPQDQNSNLTGSLWIDGITDIHAVIAGEDQGSDSVTYPDTKIYNSVGTGGDLTKFPIEQSSSDPRPNETSSSHRKLGFDMSMAPFAEFTFISGNLIWKDAPFHLKYVDEYVDKSKSPEYLPLTAKIVQDRGQVRIAEIPIMRLRRGDWKETLITQEMIRQANPDIDLNQPVYAVLSLEQSQTGKNAKGYLALDGIEDPAVTEPDDGVSATGYANVVVYKGGTITNNPAFAITQDNAAGNQRPGELEGTAHRALEFDVSALSDANPYAEFSFQSGQILRGPGEGLKAFYLKYLPSGTDSRKFLPLYVKVVLGTKVVSFPVLGLKGEPSEYIKVELTNDQLESTGITPGLSFDIVLSLERRMTGPGAKGTILVAGIEDALTAATDQGANSTTFGNAVAYPENTSVVSAQTATPRTGQAANTKYWQLQVKFNDSNDVRGMSFQGNNGTDLDIPQNGVVLHMRYEKTTGGPDLLPVQIKLIDSNGQQQIIPVLGLATHQWMEVTIPREKITNPDNIRSILILVLKNEAGANVDGLLYVEGGAAVPQSGAALQEPKAGGALVSKFLAHYYETTDLRSQRFAGYFLIPSIENLPFLAPPILAALVSLINPPWSFLQMTWIISVSISFFYAALMALTHDQIFTGRGADLEFRDAEGSDRIAVFFKFFMMGMATQVIFNNLLLGLDPGSASALPDAESLIIAATLSFLAGVALHQFFTYLSRHPKSYDFLKKESWGLLIFAASWGAVVMFAGAFPWLLNWLFNHQVPDSVISFSISFFTSVYVVILIRYIASHIYACPAKTLDAIGFGRGVSRENLSIYTLRNGILFLSAFILIVWDPFSLRMSNLSMGIALYAAMFLALFVFNLISGMWSTERSWQSAFKAQEQELQGKAPPDTYPADGAGALQVVMYYFRDSFSKGKMRGSPDQNITIALISTLATTLLYPRWDAQGLAVQVASVLILHFLVFNSTIARTVFREIGKIDFKKGWKPLAWVSLIAKAFGRPLTGLAVGALLFAVSSEIASVATQALAPLASVLSVVLFGDPALLPHWFQTALKVQNIAFMLQAAGLGMVFFYAMQLPALEVIAVLIIFVQDIYVWLTGVDEEAESELELLEKYDPQGSHIAERKNQIRYILPLNIWKHPRRFLNRVFEKFPFPTLVNEKNPLTQELILDAHNYPVQKIDNRIFLHTNAFYALFFGVPYILTIGIPLVLLAFLAISEPLLVILFHKEKPTVRRFAPLEIEKDDDSDQNVQPASVGSGAALWGMALASWAVAMAAGSALNVLHMDANSAIIGALALISIRFLVIPLLILAHEGIHAAAILASGGKPAFFIRENNGAASAITWTGLMRLSVGFGELKVGVHSSVDSAFINKSPFVIHGFALGAAVLGFLFFSSISPVIAAILAGLAAALVALLPTFRDDLLVRNESLSRKLNRQAATMPLVDLILPDDQLSLDAMFGIAGIAPAAKPVSILAPMMAQPVPSNSDTPWNALRILAHGVQDELPTKGAQESDFNAFVAAIALQLHHVPAEHHAAALAVVRRDLQALHQVLFHAEMPERNISAFKVLSTLEQEIRSGPQERTELFVDLRTPTPYNLARLGEWSNQIGNPADVQVVSNKPLDQLIQGIRAMPGFNERTIQTVIESLPKVSLTVLGDLNEAQKAGQVDADGRLVLSAVFHRNEGRNLRIVGNPWSFNLEGLSENEKRSLVFDFSFKGVPVTLVLNSYTSDVLREIAILLQQQ